MNGATVIDGRAARDQADYRDAVAEIIDDILANEKGDDRKPITLVDLAEAIGATVVTISNAKNKKSDLGPMFLTRLGKVFGAGYLNPYLRLFGAQAAPIDDSLTSDILPLVMAVGHKIAAARDPSGPGGVAEVPQERRGYLPDLKRLQNRTACLVQEIEAAA